MRKRSKYRPKPLLANPLAYVLESMTPVTQHDQYLLDLKIKNHGALAALMRGQATKLDMNTLIAMNNMVEALYRMGFGEEYGDVMTAGFVALRDACERGAASQHFVLRAAEIKALNELMELHDAQMDVITLRDMEKALLMVRKEHAAGKSHRIIPKEIA